MLYKILNDFTAIIIDSEHPDGRERRFRRQERVAGERHQLWTDSVHCNFINQDWYGIGFPLASLTPDGNMKR